MSRAWLRAQSSSFPRHCQALANPFPGTKATPPFSNRFSPSKDDAKGRFPVGVSPSLASQGFRWVGLPAARAETHCLFLPGPLSRLLARYLRALAHPAPPCHQCPAYPASEVTDNVAFGRRVIQLVAGRASIPRDGTTSLAKTKIDKNPKNCEKHKRGDRFLAASSSIASCGLGWRGLISMQLSQGFLAASATQISSIPLVWIFTSRLHLGHFVSMMSPFSTQMSLLQTQRFSCKTGSAPGHVLRQGDSPSTVPDPSLTETTANSVQYGTCPANIFSWFI